MSMLDHRGGRLAHHIFDLVLVAEPVRALSRVVHGPGPVIRRVVAKACCDAAVRRDGMAARREDLCDAGCSQALFGAAHGGAQARSTGADNNGVIDVIDDLVGGGHQAGAPVNAILRTAKIASAAPPMV